MLAVILTEHGYKIRCVSCGETGPERGSAEEAWTALMHSRGKFKARKADAGGCS